MATDRSNILDSILNIGKYDSWGSRFRPIFMPLDLASNLQPLLAKIAKLGRKLSSASFVPEMQLGHYVPALEKVATLRLPQQRMKVETLSKMVPFFDFSAVERISVDAIKHSFISMKVDHMKGTIIFGDLGIPKCYVVHGTDLFEDGGVTSKVVVIPTMYVQEHAGNENSCVWHASDFSNGEVNDELFCIRFISTKSKLASVVKQFWQHNDMMGAISVLQKLIDHVVSVQFLWTFDPSKSQDTHQVILSQRTLELESAPQSPSPSSAVLSIRVTNSLLQFQMASGLARQLANNRGLFLSSVPVSMSLLNTLEKRPEGRHLMILDKDKICIRAKTDIEVPLFESSNAITKTLMVVVVLLMSCFGRRVSDVGMYVEVMTRGSVEGFCWKNGRVTLLGVSVHAMQPNLSTYLIHSAERKNTSVDFELITKLEPARNH
ncbi:eukaryotic translation initiation factor 3 subunit A [Artemisia annua]|uniref:Eukaryotic translation initiation factor 3 subunit A n=1 Tax=Artemisia annua TaxID=35608 RepID=A0A2U1KUF2_ARTAN|nr:eukaryotic translation initiation factor 3 subunit A [Artemisia annua]